MAPFQRSVVITGCSSGFGRVTALYLSSHGWKVYATVRKQADRKSLLSEARAKGAGDNLVPVICDINKSSQIAGLAARVKKEGCCLKALLNNAGTAYPGPLELLPLRDLRAQLEINVVSQLAVTQAFLPLLRAGQGMIITVGSISGKITTPLIGAYAMSKYSLEAMSDALRLELAPWGVQVVLLEPGSSPTGIWGTSRRNMGGEPVQQRIAQGPYARLQETLDTMTRKAETAGFDPQLLARTVEKVLRKKHPRARYAIPFSSRLAIFIRKLVSDRVWDGLIRKQIKW